MQQLEDYRPDLDYIGGGLYFSPNFGGTLAASSDDLAVELGIKVYEDMMTDARISKCINVLKSGVLGNGVRFLPQLSDTNPEYPIAQEIANFCDYTLSNLQKPFREILWEMLDALVYGHKVAEITFKIDKYVNDKNYLFIKSIKTKPFGTTNFVVDQYFNLLGIAASNGNTGSYIKTRREGLSSQQTSVIKKKDIVKRKDGYYIKIDSRLNKFFSRDKFFVLTVNSANNDPRGKSILRPAYNSWNIKRQASCDFVTFLKTAAFPLLFGVTSPDANASVVMGDDGAVTKDASGRVVKYNPVAAMRDALVQSRQSMVAAVKHGSEIKEIGGKGTGIAFRNAIDLYDQQIEMAILLQTLATSEGKHQSRSASDTHFSTMEQWIHHYKELLIDAIANDILKQIIEKNFGKAYIKYMPTISLGDTQRRDFAADAAAVAGLYSVGFLSEDQKRFCDEVLGLPVRDSNYDKYRTVSAEEKLRIHSSVLEHKKLKNESLKLIQESNRLIAEQIKTLNEILISGGLDTKNTKLIQEKINLLASKIIVDDINNDSFMEELTASETAAKTILTLDGRVLDKHDDLEFGNKDLLSGIQVGNTAKEYPTSTKSASAGYVRQTKRGY